MPFITKLDFSDNRQVKQRIETIQILSGATHFGVPFSSLPTGANLDTSGITQSFFVIISTFSGNSGTTTYNWYDSRMSLGETNLSAITPSNSATTQNSGQVYQPTGYTTIDGNISATGYTGVSFNVQVTGMTDLGSGNYSGYVSTLRLDVLSATSLDFVGRTIWVDVSGITRTDELIISRSPTIGHVWTCNNSEGKGIWGPVSAATSSYWSASTGDNAIVVNYSNSLASNDNAIAEGQQTTASGIASHADGILTIASGSYSHSEGNGTTASGIASHAEGVESIASGSVSHAEGDETTASGGGSHSEGNQTIASGLYSHAEGVATTASGEVSHAEGEGTTASGLGSHAGGTNSKAIGDFSFIHSSGSTVIGNNSVVLGGSNLTGSSDNYVYVPSLNINVIGSSAFVNDIRIDATGNLTTNTSDIRFKENVDTISNALNKIKALRGVTYQWKDRVAGGDRLRLGFIAQEVAEVEPLLVFTNKNDDYKGLHIDGVIPLIVEAIKELSNGVTTSNNTHLETETIFAEDNNIDLNYSGTPTTAVGGGITVLHAMGQGSGAKLITDVDGNWTTNTDFKSKALTIPIYTPVSSNDENGSDGNITRDNKYLYLKTSEGWVRSSLERF